MTVSLLFKRVPLIAVLIVVSAGLAGADPGLPTADPAALNIGSSTTVKVTSLITDANVLPTGVNVVRVDAAGRALATLGQLRDDGSNGDLLAGDRVFSGNVTIAATAVGQVRIRVSVALRGVLLRLNSPILDIDVLPQGIPTRPSTPDPAKIVTDAQGQNIVSDEVLACFAASASVARVQSIAALVSAAIVGRFSGLGNCYQFRLPSGSTATTVHGAIQVLSAQSDVTFAETHGVGELAQLPNSPPPVQSDSEFVRTRFPQAQGFGQGQGVLVAVLDSGVNYDDPSFQPLRRGLNFGTVNPLQLNDPRDENGHGSHVAGIVRGTAPASTILAVKVQSGVGYVFAASSAAAIFYAVNEGARVINMSYSRPWIDRMEALAVAYALAHDCVMVASAGNLLSLSGAVLPVGPRFPAAYPGVISVGNIDAFDFGGLVTESNSGPWVDISAPGEHILSNGLDGGVVRKSGTSMAAPFVTGAAALIRGMNRSLPAIQVRGQILSNAVVPPNWDVGMGVGRLDALSALTGMNTIDVDPGDPLVGVDRTIQLVATPRGTRDQAVPLHEQAALKWTSDNTGVAIVDEDTGEVTGVSPGEAEITALEETSSRGIDSYCQRQGLGASCPLDKLEGEARATFQHPRRRVRVTVVEDLVSGVYQLVSFDGRALPTGIDPTRNVLLSSEIRINEKIVGAPPSTPVVALERMQILSDQSPNPPVVVDPVSAYLYTVGARSDVPVPFGHARQDQATVMLPPGLVLSGSNTFTLRSGVFATLSDDGRTLSVGEAVGLEYAHIGTYVRLPQTRTALLEPADRDLTFPETRQGTTQSQRRIIRIVNTGRDLLVVRPFPLFSNGTAFPTDFFVVSDTCPHGTFQGVAPGAACELTIEFRPRLTYRTGVRFDTLTLQTNAGSTSGDNYTDVVFFLSGEATGAPQLTVDPPVVSFLDTPAGTASIPQTILLRNSGDVRLLMQFINLFSQEFFLDASACSASFLDPGQSCAMSAVFVPYVFGETFARAATLTISSNTGNVAGIEMQTTSIPVTGNAAYARPIANAGPDQHNVSPNTNLTVDGSASRDPQGLSLDYSWTFVSRPLGSRAVLLDADERVARFVPDVDGEYILTLEVSTRFWTSPTDSVSVFVLPGPPPVPPAVPAPRVTGIGQVTFLGTWTMRFFGGDDDEEFWVKIGNEPEFEWEEDETPGRVATINFPLGEGIVRIAEDDNGEDLMPLSIQPLTDGRYLLHLHNDDEPNEIELTLVLEKVSPTP
jgi:thermitase